MDAIFGAVTGDQITLIKNDYGTPIYVYSESLLEQAARAALDFPHQYGLTVRYAMKALPTRRILQLFEGYGLHIDASSYFEVQRAQKAGISVEKIKLTAQQLPAQEDITYFIAGGGKITACSLT
ncbi:MAG: diaminopimelate decarboxylase, partial [Nanoarchaeota archaeon]